MKAFLLAMLFGIYAFVGNAQVLHGDHDFSIGWGVFSGRDMYDLMNLDDYGGAMPSPVIRAILFSPTAISCWIALPYASPQVTRWNGAHTISLITTQRSPTNTSSAILP